MADVNAVHCNNARIVAQLPRELTIANVNRVNARCATLQETIGETAGGRAQVGANLATGIEVKGIERAFQFQPAAAYVFERRADRNLGIFQDRCARFVHALTVDLDHACQDQRLSALARIGKFALYQ